MTRSGKLCFLVSDWRPGLALSGLVLLIASSYLATTRCQESQASGLPLGFPPPRTPKETLDSIVVPKGLRVELVAAEPDVVDPVAFTWDAQGRMYVVEMNDYPNGPPGGRVKLLQGIRGQGKIDRVTVFADGLPFPDGVFPWRKGILVTAAPHIWYLEDTDGDGRADLKQVIFTGFHEGNPQHRVNGLVWGLDNWIYGCNGDSGGIVRAPDRPDRPAVEIRGRDFRFRPDTREIEPVSGQSQFGQTLDAWGRRFFCNNRIHIRFAAIPERCLRRASDLAVSTTLNIAEYGPLGGAKVFPISQVQERFNDYTHTGYFTSACSVHIYLGDLLPRDYHGCAYTCEPVHNLVHRCRVLPRGSVFTALRADEDREFFASRDPWCRPVYISTGPEGALYLADFYRAVVEHPQWIPPEVQKRLDLRAGQDRGRIYRIVPEHFNSWLYPNLQTLSNLQLVKELANTNIWRRDTAQRLLYERQDKSVVPALEPMARSHPDPQARVRALWTLNGLAALSDELILDNLTHPECGLRENALILAESRLPNSLLLQEKVLSLVHDAEPRIRFHLALTLGELAPEKAYPVLARIAQQDADDPWTRLAVLTSVARDPLAFSKMLLGNSTFLESLQPGRVEFLMQLGRLIARRQKDEEIAQFLAIVLSPHLSFSHQLALVTAVLEGRVSRNPLALLDYTSTLTRKNLEYLQSRAVQILQHPDDKHAEQIVALRFLAAWSPKQAKAIAERFLHARFSNDLQLAALRAYSRDLDETSAHFLIGRLPEVSPGVRSEALEQLFRNKHTAPWILAALEKGELRPADLDARRHQQLREVLTGELRTRAEQVLGTMTPRKQVVSSYQDVLRLAGDSKRGGELFKKHCAQCHQRNGQGIAVGPNLDDVRGRTPQQLLEDILDPNAAVAPNYMTYVVETISGQIYTGIVAGETSTRIVLSRAEGARDEILRRDISEIRATLTSLMPENLEQTLSKQDLADLIAWLRQP